MSCLIKKYLKNIPPFKQFLARMHNLEKRIMICLENLQKENASLRRVIDDQRKALFDLEKEMEKKSQDYLILEKRISDYERQIKRLDARIDSSNNHMNYLYYKGLHPDCYEDAMKDWYYQRTGKVLNLDNPRTYNEKMQWIKLHDNTPLKTRLADKYLARAWVAEKIGQEYLIPLIGVWDRFDDIDFASLPNSFVLKANHGCAWNLIVKNKDEVDVLSAKSKFNLWMKKNYAFYGLELHYMNIPRKIIAEKYLEELEDVYDYKFMCFDGVVKFVWVDVGRFSHHQRLLYTPEWISMNEKITFPLADFELPKPDNYEKMLEIASILSQGFIHVRVDLYNIKGKIYFGEMTFTPGAGTLAIESEKFAMEMGTWIELPEKGTYPNG